MIKAKEKNKIIKERQSLITDRSSLLSNKQSINITQPLLLSKEKQEEQPASYLAIFKFADQKDKLLIFFGTICALLSGAAFPFFLIYFGDIVFVFLQSNRGHAAKNAFQISLIFFYLGGLTWLFSSLGMYCWNMSGTSQSLRFKKMYYKALLEQEVAWYDSNDVNKLSTEVAANVAKIQGAIGQKVFVFLNTFAMSAFGFLYAFIKCWELSLVLTGALPFILLAGILAIKSFTLSAQRSKVSYQKASSRAEQAFGGIRTIKSLVAQEYEESYFIKCLNQGQNQVKKLILYSAISIGLVNLILLSVYALGFWYGKWLLINDTKYTASIIISTFMCFVTGGSSIGQFSPLMKSFTQGKVAFTKLSKLLNRKKTLIEKQNGRKIKHIKKIEFKNMTFAYKKQNQEEKNIVLNNIKLKIKKNKINAIVGQSGSGKSTISQLILRFYDPIQGEILINGHNLKDLEINLYRKQIGFVGQQPVLFAMSIQENIRLANPTLSNDQLIQVLKKANAWQFVSKMENGIKTFVGTGGTQLSGGQKQRIAIARAISKNPELLILDQATSALDRKNQKQIQQTLQNLARQNITTIVIAHRLSTIKDADKIIVLKNGKIIEKGTHQKLITKKGQYYRLIQSQISVQQQKSKKSLNLSEQSQKDQVQYISIQNESFIEKENLISMAESQKLISKQEKQSLIKNQQKQLNSKEIFAKLFKQGSSHLLLLGVGSIASLVAGLIWPMFNISYSNLLALLSEASKNQTYINEYCILFLFVAVFGGFGTFLYSFCFGLYGERLIYDIRVKIFKKMLRLPISFYDKKQNTPGALSTKLATSAYQLHNMITGLFAVIFLNISTISLSLFVAFLYSWQLTLVALVLSPLIAIAGSISVNLIKKVTKKTQESEKFIGSLISDTVSNIRTVKSIGNGSSFLQKYQEKLEGIFKLSTQKAFKSSFFQGMGKAMTIIVQGLCFLTAGIMFQNSIIQTSNAVFVTIFSIIYAAKGVGQNTGFMPDMVKAKLAGIKIFQILDQKDQKENIVQNLDCTDENFDGQIQFKNVTFKYPQRDQVILDNFSFKIEMNKKYGFVGSSGSGKSTIAQLLLRFYKPQQGQILLNKINIQKFDLYSYRKRIGYVSQQPVVFQGTVRQNITYNLQIDQEKMKKCAQIAYASNFINSWQQQYNKQVGNKGAQISGGQKQRIALARCLYRRPKLFLFDESTSALDTDTQKVVFENLKQALQGKTCISIAHRLASIQDSNKIIMLESGKIIEQGGYKQLLQRRQRFYQLAKGI